MSEPSSPLASPRRKSRLLALSGALAGMVVGAGLWWGAAGAPAATTGDGAVASHGATPEQKRGEVRGLAARGGSLRMEESPTKPTHRRTTARQVEDSQSQTARDSSGAQPTEPLRTQRVAEQSPEDSPKTQRPKKALDGSRAALLEPPPLLPERSVLAGREPARFTRDRGVQAQRLNRRLDEHLNALRTRRDAALGTEREQLDGQLQQLEQTLELRSERVKLARKRFRATTLSKSRRSTAE